MSDLTFRVTKPLSPEVRAELRVQPEALDAMREAPKVTPGSARSNSKLAAELADIAPDQRLAELQKAGFFQEATGVWARLDIRGGAPVEQRVRFGSGDKVTIATALHPLGATVTPSPSRFLNAQLERATLHPDGTLDEFTPKGSRTLPRGEYTSGIHGNPTLAETLSPESREALLASTAGQSRPVTYGLEFEGGARHAPLTLDELANLVDHPPPRVTYGLEFEGGSTHSPISLDDVRALLSSRKPESAKTLSPELREALLASTGGQSRPVTYGLEFEGGAGPRVTYGLEFEPKRPSNDELRASVLRSLESLPPFPSGPLTFGFEAEFRPPREPILSPDGSDGLLPRQPESIDE